MRLGTHLVEQVPRRQGVRKLGKRDVAEHSLFCFQHRSLAEDLLLASRAVPQRQEDALLAAERVPVCGGNVVAAACSARPQMSAKVRNA